VTTTKDRKMIDRARPVPMTPSQNLLATKKM
jgi:hypothetical protein